MNNGDDHGPFPLRTVLDLMFPTARPHGMDHDDRLEPGAVAPRHGSGEWTASALRDELDRAAAGLIESNQPIDPARVVIGQVLFEKYLIVRKLGQGGMGLVWMVKHLELDTFRALKMILDGIATDQEMRQRFRREAKVMAAFNHPHSVTVHDAGLGPNYGYLEMEYVRGTSIERLLAPGVPMPMVWIAKVIEQLCDVLGDAHRMRIIHRDLKPANLMLLADRPVGSEFLKVLDFGLAKILADAEIDLTRNGFVGTVSYASPEQAMGDAVDERADLYSTGVLLYEFLCGHRPFLGSTIQQFEDVLRNMPPPPSVRNPNAGIAPCWDAFTLRCLSKDPARRPRTAAEFWEEFEETRNLAESGRRYRPIPASIRSGRAGDSAFESPVGPLPGSTPDAPPPRETSAAFPPQVPPSAGQAPPPVPAPPVTPPVRTIGRHVPEVRTQSLLMKGKTNPALKPMDTLNLSANPGSGVVARRVSCEWLEADAQEANLPANCQHNLAIRGGLAWAGWTPHLDNLLFLTHAGDLVTLRITERRPLHRLKLQGPIDLKRPALAVSADGRRLFRGVDNAVVGIDLSSGVEIVRLETPGRHPRQIVLDERSNRLMAAEDLLWCWDLKSLRPIIDGGALGGEVRSLAFHDDHRAAVSLSVEGSTQLWDLQGGWPIETAEISGATILCPLKTVGWAAVGGFQGQIQMWDLLGRLPASQPLGDHLSWISALATSPDGRFVAAGSRTGTLAIWNVACPGTAAHHRDAHSGEVRSIEWTSDQTRLMTIGGDDRIRIWTLPPALALHDRDPTGGSPPPPGNSLRAPTQPPIKLQATLKRPTTRMALWNRFFGRP